VEKTDFAFLFLTHEEVIATGFDMPRFVETMEEHFRLYDEGQVNLPDKVVLDLDERDRGRINALPAHVGGDIDACGIKWVASFPGNPHKHGIPRANAFIILNDAYTGVPLAVMDGTYISAMRTGAVTGVGVKYLAAKNAQTIAMIGCGLQARTQLMAIQAVLPTIAEVRCFDLHNDTAKNYARDMHGRTGLNTRSVETADEAVEGADVIVTVTVGDEAIVKDRSVKEGSLFVHVGSYQEEEEAVVQHADKIIVDDWHSVHHRKTPILAKMVDEGSLSVDDIYANLGEIVNRKKVGRANDRERIFLLPIGMGSEDVIAAYKIYQIAREKGIGQTLQLCDRFTI
jgi:N-[(2S)-2-amino-2-carboxyethyl]-L-glutamate dehydrogenase